MSLKKKSGEPYIVTRARNCQVRLIDTSNVLEKNKYYESIPMTEALNIAIAAGVDLVCFSEAGGGDLAFYKVINFGKWKYELTKKKKKQQKVSKKVTKEIRVSPDIGDHDLEHKIKQVNGFLDDGDDVIFSMRLKGRQRAHAKEAQVRILEIAEMCQNVEIVGKKLDGNSQFSVRVTRGKPPVKDD